MNENEYRTAYHGLNPNRCVYEKSILTQSCQCQYANRINIAEREGIACNDKAALQQCSEFLSHLRQHASFALKMTQIVGNLLPHSKEVQVQKGGLVGLIPGLPNTRESEINSIHHLINEAAESCDQNFEDYPYRNLIPSISHHLVVRRSRKKSRK